FRELKHVTRISNVSAKEKSIRPHPRKNQTPMSATNSVKPTKQSNTFHIDIEPATSLLVIDAWEEPSRLGHRTSTTLPAMPILQPVTIKTLRSATWLMASMPNVAHHWRGPRLLG